MIICSYGCGKEAKFFFKSGKGCCEQSPNSCEGKRKKDSDKKKGRFNGTPFWKMENYYDVRKPPWNKGKPGIYSEDHRKKISDSLKNKSTGKGSTIEKEEERKRKISETMKLNPNAGGLRAKSGRGKKGWYRGFWCDSSWELAWVIYNIDKGLIFERNYKGFEYNFEYEKHLYYPDFVSNDVYYEIKGRRNFQKLDKKSQEKIKQFKGNLVVLFEKDMRPYLDYTILKYGKDFIRLYENGENPNW